MAIHVVIVKPGYLRSILAGEKTVECRLSKTLVPPYGAVEPGERLFIKASGGPFGATALVSDVDDFDALTPADVDGLKARYNAAVRGEPAYWGNKRDSRYATFVHLSAVELMDVGPHYTKSPYKGWFVLDEARSPLLEAPVTGGALRNRYLRLPRMSQTLCDASITLHMPDGASIATSVTRQRLVRWRGWGRYYTAHGIQAGDWVRLVAIDKRQYRVSFHQRKA